MRKVVLSVIAVLLIIGAVFGAKYIIDSKTAPKPRVEKEVKIVVTDTVHNKTIPIVIPANGNLEAKRRVEIYAEVTGIFQPVSKLFRTGQEYKAGETLISIDNTEFYAQVRSARANLSNLITAIMPDLRLDYPQSYDNWQRYLDRLDTDKRIPALPEPVDQKEKYFITGRNIYRSYYDIKNLESRLAKYRIVAPFNGILTDALVSEGTLIRNGQQLGEFIQTDIYELQVAMSGEFADLIEIGEEVALYNISKTKEYTGQVVRMNGKVDQSSQTIVVVIQIEHPDLKAGMYLTAMMDAREVDQAIEIDRSLLQNGNQIFIVEEGALRLVTVQPVYFSDKNVILKGLEDGTVIISQTVAGAYEGMIVKTEEQAKAEKEKENATSTENTAA